MTTKFPLNKKKANQTRWPLKNEKARIEERFNGSLPVSREPVGAKYHDRKKGQGMQLTASSEIQVLIRIEY
jgi:FKBP-type peptidyl-prolyl cis-trans isomerase